jgi:hypothetical protein
MTDRHVAYTVTLLEPVRSDDAEQIIAAIRMIKGVAEVVPVVADAGTYWGRSTARRELLQKIWQLMQQENV